MRFFSFLAFASLSLSLITACKNEPKGVETEHGYSVVYRTVITKQVTLCVTCFVIT